MPVALETVDGPSTSRRRRTERGTICIGSPTIATQFLIALALSAASFAGQILVRQTDSSLIVHLAEWLNVDSEMNLPTWYSTMLLAGASLLCFVVARSGRMPGATRSRQWYALAAVMLFLSVDEAAQVHEKFGALLHQYELSGPFTYAWAIPWSLLAITVALLFVPFFAALPSQRRWEIAAAGAVFVGGALGLEFVEGMVATAQGDDNLRYELVATTQEFLEMVGVILFIRAVMRILAASNEVKFRFFQHASVG